MNLDPKSSESVQNRRKVTPSDPKRWLRRFKTGSEISEKTWFRGFLRISLDTTLTKITKNHDFAHRSQRFAKTLIFSFRTVPSHCKVRFGERRENSWFWTQNHPNPDNIIENSRLLTQSVDWDASKRVPKWAKNRDFVDFCGFLSIPTLQKSRKITILLTVVSALQKHWFSASERSRVTVKNALVSDAKIHEFGPKIIRIRTKPSKSHTFWPKALTETLQNGVRN